MYRWLLGLAIMRQFTYYHGTAGMLPVFNLKKRPGIKRVGGIRHSGIARYGGRAGSQRYHSARRIRQTNGF